MAIRVGIDLGTTFSSVAWINPQNTRAEIIKNIYGKTITPSVLCFEENGNILYGEDAKAMQASGDTNSIAFFKRSMGDENFRVNILGKSYNATDLSAILLEKIVKEAEKNLGKKIGSAVITVPAYFSHKERQATMDAGKKAGLDIIAIINEPTAAAFAYGLNEKGSDQTVLIYDLGGGTFDATIARIRKESIEILASGGDHQLGGKDWDMALVSYFKDEFYEEYDQEIESNFEEDSILMVEAEKAKIQLSQRENVQVSFYHDRKRLSLDLSRKDFEDITSQLLIKTEDVIEKLLKEIKMTWADIDGTILVGGSTRMVMVSDYIEKMTGKKPLAGVNVDEAVALGAAIRANIKSDGTSLLASSIESRPGKMFLGAKKITDVTAHSLGMISISPDGKKYINKKIIPKNSKIPAKNSDQFKLRTGAYDNEIEVYVSQGEYERPLDNTIVSKYVISGIEDTRTHQALVDVTYSYDENGIIGVSAIQNDNGKNLGVRSEDLEEDMSWTDKNPQDVMPKIQANVDIVLAIDLSGSMYGNPLNTAMEAMKKFAYNFNLEFTSIGIVGFAERSELIQKPSHDYNQIVDSINSLYHIDLGAGTTSQPFTKARESLIKKGNRTNKKYIVVLTDGDWYGDIDPIGESRKCIQAGIDIAALGFGAANYKFLRKISNLDDLSGMTKLDQLSGSLSKIAQAIDKGATGLSMGR
uniref:Hsp70 family protein n=1 Tax=Anaerococcus mediterraneensis TaxID=1870984 RepID=UPI000931BEF8|nr:Hsp70 family protein [Anaerococcus mediterraneensis]